VAAWAVILVETHLLVWLCGRPGQRLPAPVRARLEREQLALAPFVHLELAHLCQVGRITDPFESVLDELTTRLERTLADVSAAAVCATSTRLTWTRDPFDRLLAAHALVTGNEPVTRDETIRQHLTLAWWSE
jgi:PIN domain nuclease of toxin-antitoxin system